MPKKKNVKHLGIQTFRSRAQVIVDRIGKDRDELRDLLQEYKEILTAVDNAHDSLENAIEQLSEML